MSEQNSLKPRRMAYIISQYPTLSMIFIIREVLQLKRLGFEIDTVSVNAPDRGKEGLVADEAKEADLTYYLKPDGVKGGLRAHAKTLISNPGGYLRGWKLMFKLGKFDLKGLVMQGAYMTQGLMTGVWMQKKNQTHLHAHLGSQACTVAMYTKEIFGTTFSATIHGPDEFYNAPGQFLTEKVIASDFMVCISHFARSQMMKLSPYENWKKFEVSRLGVDPSVFSPRPFNANPEVFEILCVGRLCPAKGQHILVEAVGQIAAAGKHQVKLRLVGGGDDHESLRNQIDSLGLQNEVELVGPVNQDHIRDYYSRADIFSIPSFAEGIPVVLMESMAMEIPVVTTRITGIPELIRNGEDGLLVAPSSVEELAEAITRLMDDADLRKRLGENGRKRITEHYDLAKNVDRLADVFSQRLESLGK